MKRASIILVDGDDDAIEFYHWRVMTKGGEIPVPVVIQPSEQLLADLLVLVEKAERHPVSKSVADAAARVRALLPEEDEPAPQGSVEDIIQGIAGRNK